MTSLAPLLAHVGSPNNPYIGMMTVAAWVLLVVFVLVLVGRTQVRTPGDLLIPLAAVILTAGLTGSLGDWINDQGPWSVPAGAVVLVALLVAAFRDVDLSWGTRAASVTLGLAVVASAALYVPLDSLWFPTDPNDVPLPTLEDGEVTAEVLDPPDENGTFTVRVTLTGATFGDGISAVRPDDPETELVPRFQVGPVYLQPLIPEECASAETCTEAVFELTLPAGAAENPPDQLVVELLTADQTPFAPPLQARFELPRAAG